MKPDYEWAWKALYEEIPYRWPTYGPKLQIMMDSYIKTVKYFEAGEPCQKVEFKEVPKMRVECAMSQIRHNENLAMRRVHWTNTIVRMKDGCLKIYKIKERQYESFTLTGIGLSSEDWVVEPIPIQAPKLYSFEEALKAYKKGKKIKRLGHYIWKRITDPHLIVDQVGLDAKDWLIKED